MPKYILFILATICTIATEAQTTEKRDAFFRIQAVQKIKADSIHALLKVGTKYGITKGLYGPVKGVYSKQNDRSNTELGFGTIIYVNDTAALVAIRPKSTDTNQFIEIRKGDYVILTIPTPKLPYRSIFFELALLDIDFINLAKDAMYDFHHLLYKDSKKLEDSLLDICMHDVYETYLMFADDTSAAFENLRTPLKEGRYAGRSVMDVMKQCSKQDIKTFLNFVIDYPGKYIGNSWKINETFATWVLNNGPYSKNEVYDSVITYSTKPTLLKAFIEKNRSLLLRDEYVRDWVSKALDAIELKDSIKGNQLMYAAKIVLPFLKDANSSGYYHYVKAQIEQDKYAYSKAIQQCDTSAPYFLEAKNYRFYAEAIMKKAYCYRMLKKYDEAISNYELIPAIAEKMVSPNEASEKNNILKKYHSFVGYTYDDQGDLLKAVKSLQAAILYYEKETSFKNLEDVNSVYNTLAKIYKAQGEYAKAKAIYEDQLKKAIYVGNRKREADTRDNLGYIESKLGNYRTAINYHQSAISIHLSFNNYNSAGYSYSSIGQDLWNLGKFDSAIINHKIALDYRRRANNNNGLAYSWSKLGSLYKIVGLKNEALAAYDSTSLYYQKSKDSTNWVSNLLNIGSVYEQDKQYQKAFQYYQQAHTLNLNRKNKAELLNSLMKLSSVTFYFDTAASRLHYLEAYQMAKSIGSKSDALYAALNLGLLAFMQYDYEIGQQYFKESIAYCIAENNKSEEAYAYNHIGNALRSKIDFEQAILYYNKALHIYDSLGEKSKLPEVMINKAYAQYSMGNFKEATDLYYQTIRLANSIKSFYEVGNAYSALSFMYLMKGEVEKAIAANDSATTIFTNLNNQWQIAGTYIDKGNIYNQLSEYQTAVAYYLKADSLYLLEKDQVSRSTCKNNIGNVYFFQSDYQKALTYFIESEKLLAPIKTITQEHVLAKLNIGEVYFQQKNYTQAEKYLLEGFKIAQDKKIARYIASGNLLLGKLYFEQNKLKEAEKYLTTGYQLYKNNMSDITGLIEAGLYLGKLAAKQNQSANSIQYWQQAYSQCLKYNSEKYAWEILYELGLSFYNQNNFDSAVHYLKLAVASSEKVAAKLFGGVEAAKIYQADTKRVDVYTKLVASLVKLNKNSEALYYADRGNTQGVKEMIEQSGSAIQDEIKKQALAKSNELLQKQNAVEKAIAKELAKPEKERNQQLIASLQSVQEIAKKDYINFIDDLVKQYPDLGSYFTKINPEDFNNYIDYIPDSTIVVLYIINEKQLLIFTVTNQTTAIKTVALTSDINKQAHQFLALLNNPKVASGTKPINVRTLKLNDTKASEGDFRTAAAALYDLLITPIADDLKDKKQICIIPNGKLANIPFQSLGHFNQDKNFSFLVEDYNIFYTNKMDVFIKPFKPSNLQTSFAALGNPDKSLPKATKEVKNLSTIVSNATLYVEDQATEAAAKNSLENFKYVHFATHGVLDYTDFQKSFLLFKQIDQEDGQLTIREINGLNISGCDLVTLSACETAVTQETVKGWYISPANSFLVNRVKAVVASLWPVDDDATSILMTDFYKNLQTMPKAQALRKAQETLSKTEGYSHPYFWSAFVLYGDWR